MTSMHRITIALALAGALSCRSTAAPPDSAPSRPASAGASSPAARQTHENLNAVLWMQTAAEYRASTLQAYRLARLQLDAALADPKWTAATEQTGEASALPPAVVLDLDETVIDNSAYQARQVQDATPFSDTSWNAWTEERKATAIPGAVEFLQYARSRGVTAFYVSNRFHATEQATRDVLQRLDIPIDTTQDTVLLRNEQGWTASDKSSRRQLVASKYRVLLIVGDNFEDFVSGTRSSVADRTLLMQTYADYWGTKWIMLPNPTYGSWESALYSGSGQLTDAQALTAKYKALRTDR